ncbi:MAG TPA: hypothetical protein PK992_02740 [Planctomycetaceae bacterium]|nr:hypothetical protein [Planctomycetaceae bacterium]
MTGPADDSHKHKAEDAAKYLAESFFGLNMNPAEVGGEVLFDDYDDVAISAKSARMESDDSDELDAAVLVAGSSTADRVEATSAPNRFEENLDDLIVFSDDDDDDDIIDQDADEEDEDDDDENFDFGEDEEEDEEDDEFDEEEDDEEDEEEEDELDDADLDFGSDVIDPAPKRAAPVARESRPQREPRGSEPRSTPARVSGESRDHQRSTSSQREERPASRDTRTQGAASARSEGSDRPHAAKPAAAGRKSGAGDEDYWKELDGWVWDEETPKKAASASVPVSADLDEGDDDIDDDDDDEDEDDDLEQAAPAAASDKDEDAPARRRGRRRGGRGRGRGRGRRDEGEGETSEPAGKRSELSARTQDFDDDFSEIFFEEDQEDFVSVSAGSVKAQRRVIDEPPSPAGRVEPDDLDDEDDDEVVDGEQREESEERPDGPRRGRRGRRGRGRGRGPAQEESREPVRKEVRPAASARRPVRDEDDMDDDDDDDLTDDDAELSDFGDVDVDDDDEIPPRRREGAAREERAPEGGRGRGRGQRPARESGPGDRSDRPARERKPVVAGSVRDERHAPRPARVAAEFQGIPTWEEAIGSLEIRTPTEEHARRAESRGRRDGGGRPPRRKN